MRGQGWRNQGKKVVNREPVLPTSRCLEQDCTSASCLASGQPKSSLSPSLGEPVGLWSHTSTNDKQLIPFRMAGFSQPKAQWTKVGTPKPPGRDLTITQLQSLQLSSSHTGSGLAVPRAPCTICAAAALVACTAARGARTTAASQW